MSYVNKGEFVRNEDGSFLLINEKKQPYRVDEVVVMIWTMCDGKRGKTDIVNDLSEYLDASKDEIKKAVDEVIENLEKAELVEEKK